VSAIVDGLGLILQWQPILLIVGGVILGIILGSIPGLTATMGVALLLPLTFNMTPINGIAMLVGVYVGGISGGLISAILLGIPGTPSSIATTFDGAPMARAGKADQALGLGITSSFIGGALSGVLLLAIAPTLAKFALKFGPFEYFSLAVFGLTVVVSVSSRSLIKGLIAAVMGVILTAVGPDPINSLPRYTFGIYQLEVGFDLTASLLGLLAISQVLLEARTRESAYVYDPGAMKNFLPSLGELVASAVNLIRSSIIGVFVGALPGVGGSIASLLAYDQAKKASKNPEMFGAGHKDGLIASEAANNAMTGGAMTTMLALGIPGDAVTAILLGAFMIHGLRPGPLLFKDQAHFVYGVIMAFFIANLAMFIIETGAIRMFIKVLQVPKYILLPVILVMCALGAFAINNRIFDIWVTFGFGLLGYLMEREGFPTGPMVLGFILGPLMEVNLRVGLMTSGGDVMPFFTRPISALLLALSVFSIWFALRQQKKSAQMGGAG
jgi:putative tricarboxylic transport membrane protein